MIKTPALIIVFYSNGPFLNFTLSFFIKKYALNAEKNGKITQKDSWETVL